MAPSTSASSSKASPSTLQAISVLPTPLAQTFTHIHPLLLLILYYLAFPTLVSSPVSTMLYLLLPLSLIQLLYLILCLPPSSSGSSSAPTSNRSQPRRKAPSSSSSSITDRIIPAILSLLLTLLLAPPVTFILAVLLGAPLTTHLQHTYLLATHISLLSVLPLVYVHGMDAKRWREVVSLLLPVDETVGGLVGGVVGGWAGAVPVPLDWDREWQRWPVTVLTGVWVGYVVGKGVGGSVLKGKTIQFT